MFLFLHRVAHALLAVTAATFLGSRISSAATLEETRKAVEESNVFVKPDELARVFIAYETLVEVVGNFTFPKEVQPKRGEFEALEVYQKRFEAWAKSGRDNMARAYQQRVDSLEASYKKKLDSICIKGARPELKLGKVDYAGRPLSDEEKERDREIIIRHHIAFKAPAVIDGLSRFDPDDRAFDYRLWSGSQFKRPKKEEFDVFFVNGTHHLGDLAAVPIPEPPPPTVGFPDSKEARVAQNATSFIPCPWSAMNTTWSGEFRSANDVAKITFASIDEGRAFKELIASQQASYTVVFDVVIKANAPRDNFRVDERRYEACVIVDSAWRGLLAGYTPPSAKLRMREVSRGAKMLDVKFIPTAIWFQNSKGTLIQAASIRQQKER